MDSSTSLEGENETGKTPIAWSIRDVWFGLGLFLLWLLVSIGIGVAIEAFGWDFDIGLFLILWELILIVPAWWFTIRKYKLSWAALGFRKFDLTTLVIGCWMMVFTYLFNLFYNLGLLFRGIQSRVDVKNLFGTDTSPWLIFLAGIVVAPLVEEIFFRGFLYPGLREKYGWIPAALISAVLFAAVHLHPIIMPPIFLLGLLFAYLYERTESIWPGVIMHFATNTLGLIAAYMISRMDLLTY
jgi:membrane protease YdiL (CAAX protease family)